MKTLTFLALVGLRGLVMNAKGSLRGGFNPESDCISAETIFLASYDPKRSEPLMVKEYLYGKDTSASGLGLLEIKARAKFNHPCDLIIFAHYPKTIGDGCVSLPMLGEISFFYLVKDNQILVPHGQNVPLDELKKWIKEKESRKPQISL